MHLNLSGSMQGHFEYEFMVPLSINLKHVVGVPIFENTSTTSVQRNAELILPKGPLRSNKRVCSILFHFQPMGFLLCNSSIDLVFGFP